jgi:hypothetical protein
MPIIRNPRSRLLRDFGVADLGHSLPWVRDLAKGPIAQIQTTTSNVRTTVGDSDDDRFAVLLVGNSQAGSKREVSMCSCNTIAIETLSIRGSLAMEAVAVSVVGRSRAGSRRSASGQSGKQCQCSGAESNYSFLQW